MGILHEGISKFMIDLAKLVLEWEIYETKIVEKIKTHILYSVTFFCKLGHLRDNVEKYGTSRQAVYDNILNMCML